jgi:hypothetical protein
MSIAFLECGAFDLSTPCCEFCHAERRRLIYVRPWRDPEGNIDWNLCIEALVCCKAYNHVRAIPYEWWEAKSRELGVKRDDGRGSIFPQSPELNSDRDRSRERGREKSKAKISISKRRAFLQRDEPSLDDFLKRRR